jgi:cytochrome c oxidase assembly protein subunit 11
MSTLRFVNVQTLRKLAVLTAIMFAFGYAMVPLYQKLCEVTGINFLTRPEDDVREFAKNTQADLTRSVTVELDANSNVGSAWTFKPEKSYLTVHPGEMVTVVYKLTNTQNRDTVGQAIPSYAPAVAGQYFKKIECFCFKQQTLAANQVREFPVVFVVDPKLPKSVSTITLSYTFFELAGYDKGVKPMAAPGQTGG